MNAFDIGVSALDVEWQRFSIIAENLANINSVVNEAGDSFGARRLISGPATDFQTLLKSEGSNSVPVGVSVHSVQEIRNSLRQVYKPDHPIADANGFVNYPNIDHGQEMSLLIKTMRAYEANLQSVSIAEQMYSRALEMGRGS